MYATAAIRPRLSLELTVTVRRLRVIMSCIVSLMRRNRNHVDASNYKYMNYE